MARTRAHPEDGSRVDITACLSPDTSINSSTEVSAAAFSLEDTAFNCTQCTSTFTRRENLSRHLKTHNTSWSHVCHRCGKGFTRSDLLRRHESGHERWDVTASSSIPAPMSSSSRSKRKRPLRNGESTLSATSRKIPISPASWASGNSVEENGPTQIPFTATSDPLGTLLEHQSTVYSGIDSQQVSGELPTQENVPFNTSDRACATDDHSYPINTSLNTVQPTYEIHDESTCAPFDFSVFLLNHENDPMIGIGDEWFTTEFYSAMQETCDAQETPYESRTEALQGLTTHQIVETGAELRHHLVNLRDQGHYARPNSSDRHSELSPPRGRISRISSPPNEASEEDKWPFAWNPKSRAILRAEAISIPPDHPLRQNHSPRFDMTETTFSKLESFLQPHTSQESNIFFKFNIELPTLQEVNILIGLFFKYFAPQMPVLHLPTLDINSDLPPQLLAPMVAIGAMYSQLKHSRRYAIVLLDIARWHFRIAIEYDNSLMRESMIVYAEALLCHAGLWCGNKRSFELAEVVRGSAVKHMRNLWSDKGKNIGDAAVRVEDAPVGLTSQWQRWIAEESLRRLYWVIYTLDCQFPALLHLPPTIGVGELRGLGCPCDEDFWEAQTARRWKNLLGPASVPPSRRFSAVYSPFVLCGNLANSSPFNQDQIDFPHQGKTQLLPLNNWSAFLLLMTIHTQIFQTSQELLLASSDVDNDSVSGDEIDHAVDSNRPRSDSGVHRTQIVNASPVSGTTSQCSDQDESKRSARYLAYKKQRRMHMINLLSLWAFGYLKPSSGSDVHHTSAYFKSSAAVLYRLAVILVDVKLPDLQNAIGKDGNDGIPGAMSSLSRWVSSSPNVAEDAAYKAIESLISITPNKNENEDLQVVDTGAYGIVTLFLCYVVVWAFATVADSDHRQQLMSRVSLDPSLQCHPLYCVIRPSLEDHLVTNQDPKIGYNMDDKKKLIFKRAAETLTRFGTWGASLNLALLLHRRSEI